MRHGPGASAARAQLGKDRFHQDTIALGGLRNCGAQLGVGLIGQVTQPQFLAFHEHAQVARDQLQVRRIGRQLENEVAALVVGPADAAAPPALAQQLQVQQAGDVARLAGIRV